MAEVLAIGFPAVLQSILLITQTNLNSRMLTSEFQHTQDLLSILINNRTTWKTRLRNDDRRITEVAQRLAIRLLEIHAFLRQAIMHETSCIRKCYQSIISGSLYQQLMRLNDRFSTFVTLLGLNDILREPPSRLYQIDYYADNFFQAIEANNNINPAFNQADVIYESDSGTVYKGKLEGSYVAVKEFNMVDLPATRMLLEEMKLHNDCSMHPNVVEILRYNLTRVNSYFVLEWMPNSLHNLLHPKNPKNPNNPNVSYSQLLILMQGISSAIHFLHLFNVVHRDVQPKHILVNETFKKAKLTDFGVAVTRVKETQLNLIETAGSPSYHAPEIRKSGHTSLPSRTADIYALGVTLWECITKTEPTEGEIPKPERGCPGRGYNRTRVSSWQEQWNYRVLEKTALLCVAVDPEKRPEAFQVEAYLNKKKLPFSIGDVSILLLDWLVWHPFFSAIMLVLASAVAYVFVTSDAAVLDPRPSPLQSTLPPSSLPTNPKSYCFETTEELRRSVVAYQGGNATIHEMFGPIDNWCVEKISDFTYLFCDADYICDVFRNPHGREFIEDISKWNTTSATNMEFMFAGAVKFYGSSLGSWDMSKVKNTDYMFYYASSFDGDISNWNVSSVLHMRSMFQDASSFNRDISKWDIRSVIDMRSLMDGATKFNHNLCAWGNRTYTEQLVGNNENMFLGTNCPNTAKPDYSQSPPGPFCYVCDEV